MTGNPIVDAVDLLTAREVEHVLIGGSAAILHGSAFTTQDVDFCCNWDERNLRNLADALNTVNSRLRVIGTPQGVPLAFRVSDLKNYVSLALITDIGFLDIRKSVDGIGDYAAVFALSEVEQFGDRQIRLLGLNGIIQSKTFLKRPRDQAILPELRMMLEERGKRDR